jgi:signal transduction histidine kinase/CheY-like chemotaxis protein
MKNIRLATLGKIVIPIFIICTVAILVSFYIYHRAVLEEADALVRIMDEYNISACDAVAQRLQEVHNQARNMVAMLMWAVGLTVLVTFFYVFVVSYKFKPIKKLVQMAEELSYGDDESFARQLPNDELGDLMKTFIKYMKAEDMNIRMLEGAFEEAKNAGKAKSDFLSNMSHEIRIPMNTVIGMTSIAIAANSVERKDYALAKILDASNHLMGIVNDVLDMSKIEANMLELSPVTFVFEDMLKKVVNINNFRIIEKKHKFAVCIDQNIPYKLICDDQRLIQVITNLISNAVKFTPTGGMIILSADLVGMDGTALEIMFKVSDTGVGISETQQTRMFLPFEQAENSTARKYGGTGLGLSITKRIVELMGGDIFVSSKINEGSVFVFTVMAEMAEEEDERPQISAGKATEDIRILMIDRDSFMRDYIADLAAHYNIHCTTAISSENALELLAKGERFDLCFMDWYMLKREDIALARRIPEINGAGSLVIIMSSYGWQVAEAEAKAVGVERFLPKPVFPSGFVECINMSIGSDGSGKKQNEDTDKTDSFKGFRALLAEDMDINREIIKAVLEPTQLEIDCAENGAEAVRMYGQDPARYNIIFMDIQMPEMDGFDATRAIRALPHECAKTIPIIAMTANVFKEDVENCFAAGMDGHLGKPLDFNLILQTLHRHLRGQIPAEERRVAVRRQNGEDRRKGERRQSGVDDRRVHERRQN